MAVVTLCRMNLTRLGDHDVDQGACTFRQQGSKIGSTWSAVSAAMKVMSYQKQLEKDMASTDSPEAQAEQLRLMLDAMWASNALDIQSTVAKACSQVCTQATDSAALQIAYLLVLVEARGMACRR